MKIEKQRGEGDFTLKTNFLAINRICEVRDFTLKIGFIQAESRKDVVLLEDSFQFQSISVKISVNSQNFNQKTPNLYVEKERIVTPDLSIGDSGRIYFSFTSKDADLVKINLYYKLVPLMEEAQEASELLEYMKGTIDNFQILDKFQLEEKKLYRFLNPHIQGVHGDLKKVNSKIKISYKLEGNTLVLLGRHNENLYQYARNHRSLKENNKISLFAKFNDQIGSDIFWDQQHQNWIISKSIEKQIVPIGVIEIFLRNPESAPNYQTSDERRLHKMLDALNQLKSDPKTPGNVTLSKILSQNVKEKTPNNNSIDLFLRKETKSSLGKVYDHLDLDQKNAFKDAVSHPLSIIKGDAGTGKTEVGAFLAILAGLVEERVLVSSETNTAIDNFLERIVYYSDQLIDFIKNISIVRIHSRNYVHNNNSLCNFYLEEVIKRIQQYVTECCNNVTENVKENELKKQFGKIYANAKTLEEIIPLTFDIVLSTYGMMAEQKFKKYRSPEYDYNIIEASSGINIANWALAGSCSHNWVFLNDSQQLSPTTIGMYIPSQKPRFPEKFEMEKAIEYDPYNLKHRDISKGWGERDYKAGIYLTLGKLKNKSLISETELNAQYRIHPDLFKVICNAFNEVYRNPKNQPLGTFLDFSNADFFKEQNSRLFYFPCDEKSLIKNLINKLTAVINVLKTMMQYRNRTISIGITGMNIRIVQELIFAFQKYIDPEKSQQVPEKSILWEEGNIRIRFSSISNHQEKEYDLVFIGIESNRDRNFRKRLYTAVTRAKSYVMLFGPLVKMSHLKVGSKSTTNNEILFSLGRGI